MSVTAKKRVAVLISGRGSNMMALVEAASLPNYPAEIVAVVSNRPQAPGLVWARDQGLTTFALDHQEYPSRESFEAALHETLVGAGAELVACAGFMRLMSPKLVNRWHNAMINIHPSLLPAFKGLNTHERALAAGARITGCTVHVVRPKMDEGPILGQAAVSILDGDTPDRLAERVLAAEHRLYPQILSLFAADQYDIDEQVAHLKAEHDEGSMLFSPDL